MTRANDRLALVYVTGTYPLPTTTFIDREIRALRQRGVAITMLSVRRPPADAALSADQRELQRGVVCLLPVDPGALALAHLSYLVTAPRTYLTTLAWLLTRPHPSRRARIKTLLHFGEGVLAAHLVRDRAADEVHAHFADRAATIALVMARLLDKPLSMSVHAGADIFVEPVLLPEKIGVARRVVTCTEHNKARLAAVVGPALASKVSVVRHGLDLGRYAAPATARAADRDDTDQDDVPVVLSVGQLTERKGLVDLVAACRVLRARGIRLRCHIVGCGPQKKELLAAITRSGLDGTVILRGGLAHDDVIDEYARATAFVLPCKPAGNGDVDGIPNVLAEALAMQVPVVSTDLPAIRELITDGTNGLLVAPGDVSALAAAIDRILTQPALRTRLRANGRRSVRESFDIDVNIERFASTLWPDRLGLAGRAVRR
jgi:glycosyltransferase involved in cell wall biosynthesis